MPKTKVLIADDEKDILAIMVKRVKKEGFDVIEAKDGEEAWEKIKKEDPDVILLDLTMPKMDGFAVLKNLRETPPGKKWQPVIIVSARGELEDMKKGLSLEADHYLTKPCNMEDIIKGIKTMVHLIPQRKTSQEMEGEGEKT